MTRSRKQVLAVLQRARQPLSAAAVHHELGLCCDQATVYRTLHYLEEQDLAESFVLHCSEHGTERYYTAILGEDGEPLPHRHWFHCTRCHAFIELGNCAVSAMVRAFEDSQHVSVEHHVLYLTGLCHTCLTHAGSDAGSDAGSGTACAGNKTAP